MKKNIYVVGAIIIQDEKILCAQRGKDKSLPLLWEFPGGKIEDGETPREALMRELQEELLIDVNVEQTEFTTSVFEYDFGIVHLTAYKCQLQKNQVPQLTEHVDVKWLTIDQLNTLEWAPADIPIIEKLILENI